MIPSALTIAAGTSSGRCSAASETKCAPSAKSASTARAASRASRVLPTPPGPVSVSSRTEPARSRSPTASSRARGRSCGSAAPATCARARRRRPRPRSASGVRRRASSAWRRTSSCSSRSGCAGLDAELLDEPCARGLEGRQRVGLSSAAIQRQHLQLHQALLEGMRDDQRLQLAQQLAVAAQLEVELDPLDRSRPGAPPPAARARRQAARARSLPRAAAPRQTPSASSIAVRAASRLDRPRAPDAPGRAPPPSGRHRARRAAPPAGSRPPD